jgi:Family of unknown function (DUF6161)
MQQEFSQKLIDADSTRKSNQAAFDQMLQQGVRRAINIRKGLHRRVSRYKLNHEKSLRESTERVSKLERDYQEQLALRAPKRYWSAKRKLHAMKKADALGTMMLVGVLGLFVIGLIFAALPKVPLQQAPLYALTVPALAVGVFIWIFRIAVRIFMSHAHLESDAEERIKFVETYLALMNLEKTPEKEAMTMLLQSIFRPTSDGIVKDDGAPFPIHDLLTGNRRGG